MSDLHFVRQKIYDSYCHNDWRCKSPYLQAILSCFWQLPRNYVLQWTKQAFYINKVFQIKKPALSSSALQESIHSTNFLCLWKEQGASYLISMWIPLSRHCALSQNIFKENMRQIKSGKENYIRNWINLWVINIHYFPWFKLQSTSACYRK